MNTFLLVIQAILSALLISVVLLQSKGTGFGRAWGSTNLSFTRRGLEKLVFRLTFVLAALFILFSIVSVAA